MSLCDELRTFGVDVDGGVKRLGGAEALYQKLLGSFVGMVKEHYVPEDFDGSDYAETIEHAHAIKGASGNLSLTPIYEAYTEIVALLRADKPEEARERLKQVLPIQNDIINCIEKNM